MRQVALCLNGRPMVGTKMPVSQQEHTRIAMRVHTAFWELREGRATREEWGDLADAINAVEALVTLGKLDPARLAPVISAAIEGMCEGIRSLKATSRMVLSPLATEALRLVIAEYELALARFSGQTMLAAVNEVLGRIADQRANPDSTVQVVVA